MSRRVVIVGGGIGGAAAALHLARAGADVVLLERGRALGGLVTSFEVAGTPLELAYHYLVPGEPHILELIDELGLTDRITWFRSSIAMMIEGRIWPFTTPLDLLRFSPLPLADRIRTGVGALRLGRTADWEPLDAEPAVRWLGRLTSERAVDVIWEPLLRAKFGPIATQVPGAWMWARMKQRAGGRKRGGEYLGYLRGGFRQMFEALEVRLAGMGVEVRTGVGASRIALAGGRVAGVDTAERESIEADAVLYCGTLPGLPRLLPPDASDPRWTEAKGLGVVCAILEMSKPMTEAFWTNVVDPDIPFGGIIEHTNLIPASDYNDTSIAYLSRYFVHDEPFASTKPDDAVQIWIEALSARLRGFSRSSITGVHSFRAEYAAPLVTLGYRAKVPPIASHIEGLYLSTTAQIYPQDRGMSEGVRMGIAAAAQIMAGRGAVRDGV